MADLITLDELLVARGDDPAQIDSKTADRYEWLIGVASALARSYTGRDFGAPQLTEQRSFQYDNSGYLDIDDASAISAVAFVDSAGVASDNVLQSNQWFPQPSLRDDAPVYWYLILPGAPGSPGFSPEMGFTYNADVYYAEHQRGAGIPQMVKVTGTWGWPTVPVDIKQATIWAIEDWINRDSGEGLASEAIAGYARAWSRGSQDAPVGMAMPGRSLDVLASYQKHQV